MTTGSPVRALSPATKRRLSFAVGGVLAFILGGPAGFFLACAIVFLVRLINFILYPPA
jgi:hypothetical protein